ncbi:MAG: hypothetical protein ACI867_000848, partial [Glaciecola sp.]
QPNDMLRTGFVRPEGGWTSIRPVDPRSTSDVNDWTEGPVSTSVEY